MSKGGNDHGRADANPAGLSRHGRGKHGQRWQDAVGGKVVFRQPDSVEPQALGQAALIERVGVNLGIRLVRTA
jgi:hypothetical protein